MKLNRQAHGEFDAPVIGQVAGVYLAAMSLCDKTHDMQAQTKVLASTALVPQGYQRIE
jgi:hypothetical protein